MDSTKWKQPCRPRIHRKFFTRKDHLFTQIINAITVMRKKQIYLLPLLIFACGLNAQIPKAHPLVTIGFSPDGRLIEFPSSVVTLQKKVCFRVKVPKAYVNDQL